MNTALKEQPLTLDQIPAGRHVRIMQVMGDSNLSRKLLGLGLRVGTEVCVLQQRRRGVVVASAGCRVALGSTIANRLRIQTLRARERIIS